MRTESGSGLVMTRNALLTNLWVRHLSMPKGRSRALSSPQMPTSVPPLLYGPMALSRRSVLWNSESTSMRAYRSVMTHAG